MTMSLATAQPMISLPRLPSLIYSRALLLLGCFVLLSAVSEPTTAQVSTTQPTAVEHVGQPCRAFQILGTCLVTDRHDGRERLVLMNNNETYGCELLYIDFEKDTGTVYPAPAGAGSWSVIEVPGDRLVIGTFYDGSYMVFDLKQLAFVKAVRLGAEEYLWNLVQGADGRIYAGSYPGGRLGALDLATYRVEDCGAPAPPNLYLRTVAATAWDDIVAMFGMTEEVTRIYNITSKQWRDFPGLAAKQILGTSAVWNGYMLAHDPRSGSLEAFKDGSFKPVSPRPFPLPAGDKVELNSRLTNPENLYLQQGHRIWRYPAGSASSELELITDLNLRGGSIVAHTRTNRLLGIRGQDYLILRPGEREPEFKPIPVPSRGRPSMFLEADPQGRIWGGTQFGQTLFHYDPKTGRTLNTRTVCDASGEVYDVAFHEHRVYAASYAGGDITCYDPAAPWDQWNQKNPRPLAALGQKGYIRPVGGIRVGPDGKLYAGWMAKYGNYGGALSITDPANGKTELIENPLGKQSVTSFDLDEQRVYIGTSLEGNGLPHQPGPAKFGMLDLATKKVILEKPIAAAAAVRITFEPVTRRVAFTIKDALHLFNPADGEFVADCILDLPAITASTMIPTGDACLIAGCGQQIVRIDLAKRAFTVLVETPVAIRHLALTPDGRVYFYHNADLYRTVQPVVTIRNKD